MGTRNRVGYGYRTSPPGYTGWRNWFLGIDSWAVLWNRNYFLQFRFRLLNSYGSDSGSDFWKVTVTAPYLLWIIKSKFFTNFFLFFCLFSFYIVSCFTREKFINFNKKCEWKKMLNEGNQINNVISSSGSGTVINYGSGSDILTSYGSGTTSQTVTVRTVPVPQQYS